MKKFLLIIGFILIGISAKSQYPGIHPYAIIRDSLTLAGTHISYEEFQAFTYPDMLQFDKPIWPTGLGITNPDFSLSLDALDYSNSAISIIHNTDNTENAIEIYSGVNDIDQMGVNSYIKYGTALYGRSNYGTAIYGYAANSGLAGYFKYGHYNNTSNPIIKIEMGLGPNNVNWTGDFLLMRSSQTYGTGSWNGSFIRFNDSIGDVNNTSKFLTGYIHTTKVLEFNPRVAVTGTSYMFDTYNLLTTGYRAQFYNQASDPVNIEADGSIDLPTGAEYKINGTPIGGGSLTDGEGTTANGTAADIGGIITKSFDIESSGGDLYWSVNYASKIMEFYGYDGTDEYYLTLMPSEIQLQNWNGATSTNNVLDLTNGQSILSASSSGDNSRIVVTPLEVVITTEGLSIVGNTNFGGKIITPFQEDSYSSTMDISFDDSNFRRTDITGDVTINISDLPEGTSTLVINQDGTGRAITIGTGWGTVADYQSTLSVTADAKNIVQFINDGDDITYFIITVGN